MNPLLVSLVLGVGLALPFLLKSPEEALAEPEPEPGTTPGPVTGPALPGEYVRIEDARIVALSDRDVVTLRFANADLERGHTFRVRLNAWNPDDASYQQFHDRLHQTGPGGTVTIAADVPEFAYGLGGRAGNLEKSGGLVVMDAWRRTPSGWKDMLTPVLMVLPAVPGSDAPVRR